MVLRLLSAALLLTALAGCGDATGSPAVDLGPIERPTEVPAADGRVTTSQPVIVSDDGTGTKLCFGSMEFGGAPECADADVAGWSWTDHEGDYQVSEGVRWGSFLLIGEFDGQTFTPSEVLPATSYDPPDLEPFTIPCPEPDGGWRVVDPTRVSDQRYGELSNAAERLPGYAMTAVSGVDGSLGPTNPFETVVTVYVAGDPAEAEEVMRRSWGGMLCVIEVDHSHAELTKIQQELLGLPGLIQVGSGTPGNQVELTVFHDDGRFQRWVDEKYGQGLVDVLTILRTTTP